MPVSARQEMEFVIADLVAKRAVQAFLYAGSESSIMHPAEIEETADDRRSMVRHAFAYMVGSATHPGFGYKPLSELKDREPETAGRAWQEIEATAERVRKSYGLDEIGNRPAQSTRTTRTTGPTSAQPRASHLRVVK